jgi:hypothetical protein
LCSDIQTLQDPFRRRALLAALISEWAAIDPAGALRFFLEKNEAPGATSDDFDFPLELARAWLRRDHDAAVTALMAGGEKTQYVLQPLLRDIMRLAPERVADVVNVLPGPHNQTDHAAESAFRDFFTRDPAAARAAAESVKGPLRQQALAGVAFAWAKSDSAAAMVWAQALEPGAVRDRVLRAVLAGWAKSDPAAALRNLDLAPRPRGPMRGEPFTDLGRTSQARSLRQAAAKDWSGTLRWLRENHRNTSPSFAGLSDAISKRLSADPQATLAELREASLPPLLQSFEEALREQRGTKRDAIWAWLVQQPPDDFVFRARDAFLKSVSRQDPEYALKLLDELPSTAENQALIDTLAPERVGGL